MANKLIIYIAVMILCSYAVSAQLLISGVLYNPNGSDSDKEWIELYNPDSSYTGYCQILFGNGAQEDAWSTQWSDELAIGQEDFILIGEDQVVPEPDILASLNLQNGPDAVQLICDNNTQDLVGWGEHDFTEYYEQSSAQEVQEGHVLSRLPPFEDTDNNEQDFSEQLRNPYTKNQEASTVQITLSVANVAPEIMNIENCTDHIVSETFQLIPPLENSTEFSCDLHITDPNGQTNYTYTTELYYDGLIIRNSSSLSINILPNDASGIYMVKFFVHDQNLTVGSSTNFELLKSIGLSISPKNLSWQLTPGTIGTPQEITIENTGNTPANISLQNNLPINFSVQWQFQEYTLDRFIQLQDTLTDTQNLQITPKDLDNLRAGMHQGALEILVQ